MIQRCKNCERTNTKHEYQDEKSGQFNREFNVWILAGKELKRCTVCGEKVSEGKEK